jgi:hypothetical protein
VVRGIQVDKIALAKTIAHELAHCQGVHHGKAMKNPRYGWAKGWKEVWAWAEDLPLTMNADPVKEKPKGADLALKKMEHCQKQVDVWKRKLKLAQTKVRTWNRKLRYHELRAAAMTTSKEDETTKEGVTT